jgi:hypothetical protein
MIFRHTSKEPGMWRGWLKNGQSVELSWSKHGWEFGGGVHIHGNDDDLGNRMLFIKFWRATVVLPLGVVLHPWARFEEPQWSAYASSEFGLVLRWGQRRKSFDWPWSLHTLAYEHQLPDGSWADIMARFLSDEARSEPYTEAHPYTYVLRSGKVQDRVATISKRRHVLTWRAFRAIGWPRWIKESIDIQFDHEVGERSGSWKGGCIGCGYDLRPGETMEQALRRMEAERKF